MTRNYNGLLHLMINIYHKFTHDKNVWISQSFTLCYRHHVCPTSSDQWNLMVNISGMSVMQAVETGAVSWCPGSYSQGSGQSKLRGDGAWSICTANCLPAGYDEGIIPTSTTAPSSVLKVNMWLSLRKHQWPHDVDPERILFPLIGVKPLGQMVPLYWFILLFK